MDRWRVDDESPSLSMTQKGIWWLEGRFKGPKRDVLHPWRHVELLQSIYLARAPMSTGGEVQTGCEELKRGRDFLDALIWKNRRQESG